MNRKKILAALLVLATAAPSGAEQATPEERADEAARIEEFNDRMEALQVEAIQRTMIDSLRLPPTQGHPASGASDGSDADRPSGCDAQGRGGDGGDGGGCRLVWRDEDGVQKLAWVSSASADGAGVRPATLGIDGRFY